MFLREETEKQPPINIGQLATVLQIPWREHLIAGLNCLRGIIAAFKPVCPNETFAAGYTDVGFGPRVTWQAALKFSYVA